PYTTLFRSHREATRGRGMGVDALDAGDADPVEVAPDARRARDGVEERALVGRVVGHESVSEDGVVAIVNGPHLDEEGVVFRPAVIAREFPEGAFQLLRVRRDHALDRDLGARGVEEAR